MPNVWPWCLPEMPDPVDWEVFADSAEEEGDLTLSAALRSVPQWQAVVLASKESYRERRAEPCELRFNERNWRWIRWFPLKGHPRPRGACTRDGQPAYCWPDPFDPQDILGTAPHKHYLGEILRRPLRQFVCDRLAKIVGLNYAEGLGPFLDDKWVLCDLTRDRNEFYKGVAHGQSGGF